MTTPTGPIVGTASVAITPSTAAFTTQLRAGLQSAQQAVSDAADDMGDSIANQISAGAARARLALEAMTAGLNDRINVTVNVSKSLVGGLESIGGSAVKAGAGIGALGLAAGNAAFALGSLLATASELSGIMIALPAVVGSAALVMGTLKLATQGVSDAIGAGLSGDLEAFSAALDKLSPSARRFAVDLASFKSRFDDLKEAVQENFFAQFEMSAGKFMQNIIPIGEKGLPRISTELGKITGEFFKVSNSSGTLFKGLQALVDQTVSGLQRWKGVTGELSQALGNLFLVGSGFAGDMIGGIGGLIARFSEWVNAATASGELQARLQDALDAFASLGRIIQNVSHAFGAFWFAGQEAGASFLSVLEGITGQLATFLNSDAGISSLTSLMTAGATAASILGDVIDRLLPIIGQLVMSMSVALTGALELVAPALRTFIEGFGEFASNATGGITNAITMLARGFSGILEAITPLLPVLGEIVGLLAEHFASVVNIAASVLGDFFNALAPFLPQLKALIENGLDAFVQALTMLADAIMPLMPVLIDLALNVLQTLIDVFIVVMDTIEPFLPMLTQLATQVLTLVAEHFMNLFQAIQPLAPVLIELISTGLEVLAKILPVVVETFEPLLPIIVDVAKTVAKSLAPVLPAVADAFKEIFEQLGPVLPQLAELGGQILVSAAQLFTALVKAVLPLVPPLIEIGTEILATLMPAFNDLLQALIPLLPVISELAVQLLRDALLPVIQALLPIVPLLVDAFIQLLPPFVDMLVPLTDIVIQLTPLITLLADLANVILVVTLPAVVLWITTLNELRTIALTLLSAAIDALVVVIKIAWDAIVATIEIAWIIIKGIFDTIISVLQGDFGEAWNRLERLVKDVWNRLKEFILGAVGDIVQYLVEWGPKLYEAAKNAAQRIWDAFKEIFGGIFGSFAGWIVDLVKWLGGFKGAIGLFFSEAGKWLYNSGKDLIQGFINGIVDKAEELYEKLKGVVNKAKELWDGATGWLMGSPSKWMAQRGKWVVQGFAQGLEKNEDLAVSATQNLVNATQAPLQTSALAPTVNLAGLLGTAAVAAPGATAGGTMQTSAVTFGQGAVIVSFEGVVPSEADALRTGQAVGRGIIDVIAERDARLAVRVL